MQCEMDIGKIVAERPSRNAVTVRAVSQTSQAGLGNAIFPAEVTYLFSLAQDVLVHPNPPPSARTALLLLVARAGTTARGATTLSVTPAAPVTGPSPAIEWASALAGTSPGG